MPPFLRSLYFRVLVAIALGVIVGVVWPSFGAQLGVLGEGFVKLVKMTIAPLVFCTLVVGIAGMTGVKSVGKAGGLAILYFELMSSLALVVGLVVINVVQPGVGMNLHPGAQEAAAIAKYAEPTEVHTVTKFVMDIIPDTLVGAFTKGELLPVLLVAFLVAFALQRMGERGKPVLELIDRFGHVVFGIVGMIMELAPIGAFGAMAFTVGSFGAHELVPLAWLMGCFYLTCLLFLFGVLGTVARISGFSIFRFVRYIAGELALVLGTSSSESALPRLMEKLEKLGASKSVVGLVVPAGYSFNLDGTSIYLTMAAVFVAQATNTPLDIEHQLVLLAILLLTSKGAAGVTGSGFIVLAATLHTVGDVPVAGLAVILGIDRFMSEGRALTNIVGNGVATLVVARVVGELDRDKLAAELAAGPDPATAPRAR